jgi:hypothetical protein
LSSYIDPDKRRVPAPRQQQQQQQQQQEEEDNEIEDIEEGEEETRRIYGLVKKLIFSNLPQIYLAKS